MAPVRRSKRLKQRRNQQNQPNQRAPVGWNDLPYELKVPIYKYLFDFTDRIVPLACPVRRAQEINNAQGRWIAHESFYRGYSVLAANGAMRDEARRAIKRRYIPIYLDVFASLYSVRLTHDGPTPDNYIELLNQVIPRHVWRRITHLVIHMDHMNCLRQRRPANGGHPLRTSADVTGLFGLISFPRSAITVWCPTFEEGWKFIEVLPCFWFWQAEALNALRNMKINELRRHIRWCIDVNQTFHMGAAAFSLFPTPAIWARDWAEALSRHWAYQFNKRIEFPISMKKMAHLEITRHGHVFLKVVARKDSFCGWSYEPRQRPLFVPDRLKVPGSSLRRAARLA